METTFNDNTTARDEWLRQGTESIFAVNLPLKLSPATVVNAEIGSLTSLHTLFDKYLDHILEKFDQNCKVQTTRNFQLFDKKMGF